MGVTLRKWKPVGLFSESMVLWEEYLHGKDLRARVVVCLSASFTSQTASSQPQSLIISLLFFPESRSFA